MPTFHTLPAGNIHKHDSYSLHTSHQLMCQNPGRRENGWPRILNTAVLLRRSRNFPSKSIRIILQEIVSLQNEMDISTSYGQTHSYEIYSWMQSARTKAVRVLPKGASALY